ncbi:hypothetical protein CDES_12715 [Corynebacterium deserti GIMN1.010]|uniref:Uncharacterized protein n=1 Tax=Corynebacterium deserti GIMN1.010 TaxID=931089 RepID=A0A0M4CZA6_9CORY|nr:hypothetical protein CDES_12715 [Corynebacterium deserti GIMN1.010]
MVSEINLELCWICAVHPATTREHMVLKARLDLMDHQGGGLTVQTPRSERPTIVRGSKSPAVKFEKILCSQCNGAKSQK